MTDPLAPDDPTSIGEYELVGRLGVGGMGTVFLAQTRGGNPVAVKVIHSHLLSDPTLRRRFAREVRIATTISSPFTAAVVDADLDHSPPFMVTEFVRGLSLRDHVATHGPLDEEQVVALAAGLAQGLAEIHRHDTAHRDLTPANVLLAEDGPRIIDLGLAVGTDDTRFTSTGLAVGTPGWLAPERIVDGAAGTPADVFSWGLLVCFAATGTNPFGSGPAETMLYRLVHEAPVVPELTGDLGEIVAAALRRDPGARPSAQQLLRRTLGRTAATDDETLLAVTRDLTTDVWTLPATRIDTDAPLSDHTGAGTSRPQKRWVRAVAAAIALGTVAVVVAVAGTTMRSPASSPSITEEPDTAVSPPLAGPDTGTTEPTAVPSPFESAQEVEESQPAEVEETEQVAAPGRPGLPEAEWATDPVAATAPDVIAVRDEFYKWFDCTLYMPTEVVSGGGLGDIELSYAEPAPRIGDFQIGWGYRDEDGIVRGGPISMSIWETDNQNVIRFFDDDPEGGVYADGSVLRQSADDSFNWLLAVPGEDCFYEITVDSMAARSWAFGSMRPVAPAD